MQPGCSIQTLPNTPGRAAAKARERSDTAAVGSCNVLLRRFDAAAQRRAAGKMLRWHDAHRGVAEEGRAVHPQRLGDVLDERHARQHVLVPEECVPVDDLAQVDLAEDSRVAGLSA